MNKFEIKSVVAPNTILFSAKAASMKECVEQAIRQKISLVGADLHDQDLSGIDLSNQDLSYANLNHCFLTGGWAQDTLFVETTFIGANLNGIFAHSANFTGGKIVGAVARCSLLTSALMVRTDARGTDFWGANLMFANLRNAWLGELVNKQRTAFGYTDLCLTFFDGAMWNNEALIGDRPVLQIGPIGSRADCLVAYITTENIYAQAGCFFGPIEQFKQRIKSFCIGNVLIEYRSAARMIEQHAKLYR